MDKLEVSDVDLVQKYIKDQSKDAFGEIYARYVRVVYRYVYSRVGKKEITEDITSETFMTLIDVIKNYDGRYKLSTFIIGIAINKMRQYFQKHRANEVEFIDNYEILDNDEVVDNVDSSIHAKQIETMMSKLETREKVVLQSRFLEGKSVKDTAKALEITQENVRIIQFRAIKKLKKLFEIDDKANEKQ